MRLDSLRSLVYPHPILLEYKEELSSLGIEVVRYSLKDRLSNSGRMGWAQPDNVHKGRGRIAISARDPLPRETLLHETAHVLLFHLLGDERVHEMEAALVAYFAARALGWDKEAASAARYAKRYARKLRSADGSDEEGDAIVLSAYTPDGVTQKKIIDTADRIVSVIQSPRGKLKNV